MPDSTRNLSIWPIPLSEIEDIVSAHLGPGRIRSNAAAVCLSRQVSMYLAKHVGGWSLPKIGRFYNGRHHSTVLHAVAKIERLRKTDEAFDALLDVLTATLVSEKYETPKLASPPHPELIEAVASRVIERLKEMMPIPRKADMTVTTIEGLALHGTPTGQPSSGSMPPNNA